jgi:hypothetical protein
LVLRIDKAQQIQNYMKKDYRNWFWIVGIFFANTLNAQFIVTSGTTMNVTTGTTVNIVGLNLQNNTGGIINHSGTIIMAGNATGRDIINNGTFNGSAGTIQMTGSTEQQVQGSSVVDIGTFTINNGGNGVSVTNTGALRIHNTLNLTNGRLFTANASPVRFTTSANNPTETDANHIRGTAIMEARTVNAAAFLTFLMFSMAAGGDVGNLTLTRRSGDGTATSRGFVPTQGFVNPIGFESIDVHWIVDITNTTAGNRNATFSWISDWDNGRNLAQMQLWRTTSPFTIATPWFLYNAGLLNLTTRTHTENNIPLSALRNGWTLSDNVNPLPVDMLAFDVRLVKGKDVEVLWTTLNELNVSHYVVERSADNVNFERIGSVTAKNLAENNYLHTDWNAKDLGKSVLYYRLVQVEQSGAKRTTPSKPVHFNKTFWAGIYPNPYKDELNVRIYNPEGKTILLTITDNLGNTHLRTTLQGEEIHFKPSDKLPQLPAGVYFLQISDGSQTELYKIARQ